MPDRLSCPIVLPADTGEVDPDAVVTSARSLLQALHQVPDPWARRGVRHRFVSILTLAVLAMLTGVRGYASIWRWSRTIQPTTRAALGIKASIPCESTIRRTLQHVDPDALNAVVAAWLSAHLNHLDAIADERFDTTMISVTRTVTVIAVDGKHVRGSRTPDQPGTHLLAAFDTRRGVVLDQVGVDAKSNEMTHLPTLLTKLTDRGLLGNGAVVTADAMHTQRATAAAIVAAGSDYVLTVKKNHPKLHDHLHRLPWAQMPTTNSSYDRGHGRIEERHTIIASVADSAGGIREFPHATQVMRVVRRRRRLGQRPGQDSVEIVYLITSIAPGRIGDEALSGIVRTHWGVENRLHYVRDVAFDEDRCRARTGNGAAVLASVRNLVITVLRLLGYGNITAALQDHAGDRDRPLRTLQRLS